MISAGFERLLCVQFPANPLHCRRRDGPSGARVSDDLGKDIEVGSSGDLALAHWGLVVISEWF
jgi:hypothetical protein